MHGGWVRRQEPCEHLGGGRSTIRKGAAASPVTRNKLTQNLAAANNPQFLSRGLPGHGIWAPLTRVLEAGLWPHLKALWGGGGGSASKFTHVAVGRPLSLAT